MDAQVDHSHFSMYDLSMQSFASINCVSKNVTLLSLQGCGPQTAFAFCKQQANKESVFTFIRHRTKPMSNRKGLSIREQLGGKSIGKDQKMPLTHMEEGQFYPFVWTESPFLIDQLCETWLVLKHEPKFGQSFLTNAKSPVSHNMPCKGWVLCMVCTWGGGRWWQSTVASLLGGRKLIWLSECLPKTTWSLLNFGTAFASDFILKLHLLGWDLEKLSGNSHRTPSIYYICGCWKTVAVEEQALHTHLWKNKIGVCVCIVPLEAINCSFLQI